MSLYKRGPFWWIRKDPVTGFRRSTRCHNKKAAELYEAERERIAADPHYAASYEATVGKWADELNAMKLRTKAEGTANMYRTKLGHIVRIFGADCPLVDVTPGNVDKYIATRQEDGAVNNTIGKELTALFQLCKMAARAGEFPPGNLATLKPQGFSIEYTPRDRSLSAAEVERLLGKLPPKRAAGFALALATGARHSEIGRITREHIDMTRWVVHVAGTKTKASNRQVPVVLPQQRKLLEMALPFLPIRWARMSKDLPELCERLEMPAVTANDLRRTFSTWLIEAGAERDDVARIMGHKSTQMIYKVYGRESADAVGRNIAKSTGTQASQYAPDGSECAGGPELRTACDSCIVAPEGVEPSRPEGPRILSPKSAEPYTGITWLFRCNLLGSVAPDSAYSRDVGTPASQFRELSRAWFGDVAGALQ